jgi:hypothetical protein
MLQILTPARIRQGWIGVSKKIWRFLRRRSHRPDAAFFWVRDAATARGSFQMALSLLKEV